MGTKKVLFSAFWIIALICISFKATDATFRKKRTNVETFAAQPRMYLGKILVNSGGCFDRKCKRDVSYTQQENMPQNQSQKVKSLTWPFKGEKNSEMLTFKGWSASGMPFNVLYIPNGIHHKILFSLNYASANRLLSNPKSQETEIPQKYLPIKKQQKKLFEKLYLRSPNLRRHVLVIPHLFVSYGWGPIGK